MKEIKVKSKRLIIRPMTDQRLTERIKTEADEHMRQAYSEMLAGCVEHPDQRLWHTEWEIFLKDGSSIGGLGFKGPAKNGEVELGYGIDPPFQGKGYATEAARAMIEWAFSNDKVYFVTAEAEADNAASLRVIEKLGFVRYGMGEEGPRFELEKPKTAWSAIFACLYMSTGMSLGIASDHMALGMLIGAAVGILFGMSLDLSDRKKRDADRAARRAVQKND